MDRHYAESAGYVAVAKELEEFDSGVPLSHRVVTGASPTKRRPSMVSYPEDGELAPGSIV